MKKAVFFFLMILLSLSLKAQIFTPNGSIQGVSANDNVGIGTQNPGAKLSVQAGPDGYPTPLKAISIWGPNSPANANSAQDLSWDFAAAGSSVIRSYRGSDFDTYLEFMTTSQYAGNSPQVRMHISHNGNIGVGTNNPSTKLEVYGTIKSYEPLPLGTNLNSFQLINERSGNVGENTIINRLWSIRDGVLNNWYSSRLHDGISVDASFKTPKVDTKTWWERDPLDDIQSWGNQAETYVTINKGNVGIGTINPTSKLTVAGNIASREVKVTVDAGADFVFDSTYKLLSLESLDQYIKQNKHLPEIASAAEMKRDGINLSEMNIKLLQKMEEMTLYMIEQNNRMNKLENENKVLKMKIDSIEK